jgi:hypothetical protein
MTSLFQPIAAESVPEKDGLIHGVSAQELQMLGEECIEAKTKAYCTYGLWQRHDGYADENAKALTRYSALAHPSS